MSDDVLTSAIARIPTGGWAVAVSGGADSVALLRLLADRPDLRLHVVHLDHQTRGEASTADARFVADLAATLHLPATIALRSDVEAAMGDLPGNTSSRYRAARMALFRQVVTDHGLSGVVLAHHADDQAETIWVRLLRGSGPMGLAGMEAVADLGGLSMVRPLLGVRRSQIRDYLRERGQTWREDASNESDKYLRNRLRRLLMSDAGLFAPLIELGEACRSLRDWARSAAPELGTAFEAKQLADLPPILAAESARRWLIEQGVPPDQITPATISRLIRMAADAGSAVRAHFPGRVLIRRRKGLVCGP